VAISSKLLNDGEYVVVSTRTHVKVLLGALLALLVTSSVAAFAFGLVRTQVGNDGARTVLDLAIALLAALAILKWVLGPFVRWYTTSYTFTNRRFMQRAGLVSKQGRTIPLNRISGVDFEIGWTDRLFGCGTLVVSDASELGRVPLHDIPRVEHVHKQVAEELHRLTERDRPGDDGT
jgi:membrane protein YdbS with pleckstrin-like domain